MDLSECLVTISYKPLGIKSVLLRCKSQIKLLSAPFTGMHEEKSLNICIFELLKLRFPSCKTLIISILFLVVFFIIY